VSDAPRPLRIALIGSFRYPIREPFAGGLEAHLATAARALQRRGHEVTLFAAGGSDPDLHVEVMAPGNDVPDAPGHRRDISDTPEIVSAERDAYGTLMDRLHSELADAFDVVHNHSLHHLPYTMAAGLPRPMISTLHTPPFPRLESALRSMTRGSVRCVAVSEQVRAAWAPVAPGARVIPNGVDTQRWRPGPGGPDLVWTGRLVPEKGPHLAIDAARRAGRRLRLAGPVVDHDYVDREIRPRLGDAVDYLGHLDQRTLADVVGAAGAALVTPMWDEPYGLVVAEALACGTPVVAFARGGIPETLTPECGRLVAPGDVGAMAEAVVEAEALPRAAARRRAVTHCSLATMIDRLEVLYREDAA
jgi:glycosyltransferase involved in cell wall biosynthesis